MPSAGPLEGLLGHDDAFLGKGLEEDLAGGRVVRCLNAGLADLALENKVDGDTTRHTDQLGHSGRSSRTGGRAELLQGGGDGFLAKGTAFSMGQAQVMQRINSQLVRQIE